MKQRTLTKEEQILVLETQINERALIIYVIESSLMDLCFPKEYKKALKDEIKNHKCCLNEYKGELKSLKRSK